MCPDRAHSPNHKLKPRCRNGAVLCNSIIGLCDILLVCLSFLEEKQQQIFMAGAQKQHIDTTLIQILLSLLHNHWMGFRGAPHRRGPSGVLSQQQATVGEPPGFERRSRGTPSTLKGVLNIVYLLGLLLDVRTTQTELV